jgi:hypothetical protein
MLLKELNQFQIVSLCILGVIYWGLAVFAIRHAGHIMFANDLRRFGMYLASIPILYVTMVFSEGLVGIGRKQRLASVILMTASATLFDGIALMWFPILYENPTIRKTNPPAAVIISRMGAAWTLYGVAASFFIVFLA